ERAGGSPFSDARPSAYANQDQHSNNTGEKADLAHMNSPSEFSSPFRDAALTSQRRDFQFPAPMPRHLMRCRLFDICLFLVVCLVFICDHLLQKGVHLLELYG